MIRKIFLNLLLVSFIVLFIILLMEYLNYFLERSKYQQEIQNLKLINSEANDNNNDYESNDNSKTIIPNLAGWIKIEGTLLDYPVMYIPGDSQFYLSHNALGEESSYGTPFIAGECDPESNHQIIYAHHMKDGLMFQTLINYAKEDFFNDHPIILYAKNNENLRGFKIISVFYTKIDSDSSYDESFDYFNYYNLENIDSFNEYIENIKALSIYDIKETVNFGDQIITLSTCSYHTQNGRFVVVAKKL